MTTAFIANGSARRYDLNLWIGHSEARRTFLLDQPRRRRGCNPGEEGDADVESSD